MTSASIARGPFGSQLPRHATRSTLAGRIRRPLLTARSSLPTAHARVHACLQMESILSSDPKARDDPAVRQQLTQIGLARKVVEERTTSFLLLDDVLILARFLEQQMFGGSMTQM